MCAGERSEISKMETPEAWLRAIACSRMFRNKRFGLADRAKRRGAARRFSTFCSGMFTGVRAKAF